MSDGEASFAQALLARFAGCYESPGGEVWVRRVDALEAVAMAEEMGLRLLGLEGFMVGAANVFPALSRIADFSTDTPEIGFVKARALLAGDWTTPPADLHRDAAGDYMIDLVVEE